MGDPGDLRGEARLADPRLTGEQDEAAPAGSGCLPGRLQPGELLFPPHQGEGVVPLEWEGKGHGHLRARGPRHLAGGNGFGEAFERQPAEQFEGEPAPVADEPVEEGRGQDLAAAGPAAETLGDDHRRAEEVVLVADGLAGVDPDPNRQGLGPPSGLLDDRVLDPDGATAGGKHRSVAIAEELTAQLRDIRLSAHASHRDLGRE